jgi:hypothetical protein
LGFLREDDQSHASEGHTSSYRSTHPCASTKDAADKRDISKSNLPLDSQGEIMLARRVLARFYIARYHVD